jgi:hypothetical protein
MQFVDLRTLEQVSQVCRSWFNVAKRAKQAWLAALGVKLPSSESGTPPLQNLIVANVSTKIRLYNQKTHGL